MPWLELGAFASCQRAMVEPGGSVTSPPNTHPVQKQASVSLQDKPQSTTSCQQPAASWEGSGTLDLRACGPGLSAGTGAPVQTSSVVTGQPPAREQYPAPVVRFFLFSPPPYSACDHSLPWPNLRKSIPGVEGEAVRAQKIPSHFWVAQEYNQAPISPGSPLPWKCLGLLDLCLCCAMPANGNILLTVGTCGSWGQPTGPTQKL